MDCVLAQCKRLIGAENLMTTGTMDLLSQLVKMAVSFTRSRSSVRRIHEYYRNDEQRYLDRIEGRSCQVNLQREHKFEGTPKSGCALHVCVSKPAAESYHNQPRSNKGGFGSQSTDDFASTNLDGSDTRVHVEESDSDSEDEAHLGIITHWTSPIDRLEAMHEEVTVEAKQAPPDEAGRPGFADAWRGELLAAGLAHRGCDPMAHLHELTTSYVA